MISIFIKLSLIIRLLRHFKIIKRKESWHMELYIKHAQKSWILFEIFSDIISERRLRIVWCIKNQILVVV